MDAELVTLASTAAATAVTLATTDVWGQAKHKLVALWRRFRPDQADTILAELDQGQHDLETGDPAITRAVTLDWEARLLRLLAADAAVAAELGRAVAELRELSAPAPARRDIRQEAHADHHSTVIQIGGDLHGDVRH